MFNFNPSVINSVRKEMGTTQAKQPDDRDTPSPNPPNGKNRLHFSEKQTTFAVREKLGSISGEFLKIYGESGEQEFSVKGTKLSLKENKTLRDMEGNEIFHINERLKTSNMRENLQIVRGDDKKVLYTLMKGAGLADRNKVSCFEGDTEGFDKTYEIVRGSRGKEFIISDKNGQIVCRVKQRIFNTSDLLNSERYSVQVESGQNVGLMLAFTVSIDEFFDDDDY